MKNIPQAAPLRLLIVDGSNLLFQMFYGMPTRILNARGEAIQGTLGFVGALLKILRRVTPTHAVVLFDGEHENARTAINADYKANRPDFSEMPEEETPFSQLPYVYAALDHLRIPHKETVDCETDDWVAAYAAAYGRCAEIVISSFDSDFFQLVSERISVLRYRGDNTVVCTPDYVNGRFGVPPERYADFKALVGDTADNIKGATRVGPKTAAALLSRFGDLECVLKNADAVANAAVREGLVRDADRLRDNYRLIKLEGEVPLPFSLEALTYADTGETTRSVLRAIGLQ
ncbi:MAG: 5'-3' exonuclease [Clostridia bacterium]|nr:5'-3' exonuclease [Clostridia bacterium]